MSSVESDRNVVAATDSIEVVRLRPRVRNRVVSAVLLTVPWAVLPFYLVTDAESRGDWLLWVLLLVMLAQVVARWMIVVGIARQPWAVQIGPEGVAWFGSSRTLRWSDLERVEVHLTRGWRRLLPHGFDRVLLVRPVEADFADRAGVAPTSRAVVVAFVRTTPAEVVAAVERFSDVPVHGWPEGR